MASDFAILGTRGIPARYGGFETFAEELGSRLVAGGVNVTVFCEATSTNRPKTYRGMSLTYVWSPKLGPLSTIVFDILCLIRARKDFEIVYMLGYSASFFCFFPRIFGSTVWINMDGVEWQRSKWSWVGRTYIRLAAQFAMWSANRIIADAVAIAHVLKGTFRRVPQCTVIAYGASIPTQANGIDQVLTKWSLKRYQYYLVVCRLEPENHVREIISGYVNSKSSHELVIVGDHTRVAEYVKNLVRSNASNRVRFLGTIYDQPQLQIVREHAFAYFHGHSVGGTNPSLLEAMACGNAIVAHDNPFNREVAGDAALFFRDAKAIPEYCKSLESDESQRLTLGQLALARVVQHYSWERITAQYLELIRPAQSDGNSNASK